LVKINEEMFNFQKSVKLNICNTMLITFTATTSQSNREGGIMSKTRHRCTNNKFELGGISASAARQHLCYMSMLSVTKRMEMPGSLWTRRLSSRTSTCTARASWVQTNQILSFVFRYKRIRILKYEYFQT
jgi:hypothetical protein